MFLMDAPLAGSGALETYRPRGRLTARTPRTRTGLVPRPFLARVRLCMSQRFTASAVRGDREAYFSCLLVRLAPRSAAGCVGTFWTEQAVSRCPRTRSMALRSAHAGPPSGSTVGRRLALRPEFSAQAQMPPTALRCARGERRGLLVLTAVPVASRWQALPSRPGGFVPTR